MYFQPKNLFNVTPLDLSEMNADEETKSEVEVTDPTSLGNRPLVLPDLTCDTPLPKRHIKRTSDIVDDTQKRYIRVYVRLFFFQCFCPIFKRTFQL